MREKVTPTPAQLGICDTSRRRQYASSWPPPFDRIIPGVTLVRWGGKKHNYETEQSKSDLACRSQRQEDFTLLSSLSGVSGRLGYRGSLEAVNRISPSDRRSEVVSSYLVAVYAGNSVPVIGIGLLSAITASLVAHKVFAVVIMVLWTKAVILTLALWSLPYAKEGLW
jgi:hypothetical protein